MELILGAIMKLPDQAFRAIVLGALAVILGLLWADHSAIGRVDGKLDGLRNRDHYFHGEPEGKK